MTPDTQRRGAMLTSEQVLRLKGYVLDRQTELGLTIKDILPSQTYNGLMNGRPMRLATTRRIDDAMQWRPGSARRAALGEGTPEPLPQEGDAFVIELPPGSGAATVEEVWIELGKAQSTAPTLKPETRRKLIATVQALIEQDQRGY